MAQPVHSVTIGPSAFPLPSQPSPRLSLPTPRPDSIESSSTPASEEGCLASLKRFLSGFYGAIAESLHWVITKVQGLCAHKEAGVSVIHSVCVPPQAELNALREKQSRENRAFETEMVEQRAAMENRQTDRLAALESAQRASGAVLAQQTEIRKQIIAQSSTESVCQATQTALTNAADALGIAQLNAVLAVQANPLKAFAAANAAVTRAQAAYDSALEKSEAVAAAMERTNRLLLDSKREVAETLEQAIDALCKAQLAAIDARGTPGFAASEAEVATAQAAHDIAAEKWNHVYRGFFSS